nr:hypothetical protein BaRGS_006903 [Batillaria attramentaria]
MRKVSTIRAFGSQQNPNMAAQSEDGKYIVTGGEDDLVTVWAFHEKRVICRGHGHRSWVNVVAFDEYTCMSYRKESQDKKEHKRNFSLASRNSDRVGLLSKSNHVKPV